MGSLWTERTEPQAMLRRWIRIAALIASLLLCLLPHIACRVLHRPSPWPRYFLKLASRAVGARIDIAGTPHDGDMFLLANHVSWVDILVLGSATGAAFVAKDGIAGWPLIGWLAAQNNTLFIARERRAKLSGQIEALRAAMLGHQPLALFPEGTTSDGSGLLPFKPALLAVLLPPPRAVMIQPVHIDYGTNITAIAWHGDEPAGANAKRLLGRKGRLDVTLRFLEPFDPATCADRKQIAAIAHTRIAQSIAQNVPRHHRPSASPLPPV